jgi:hypothetical protein
VSRAHKSPLLAKNVDVTIFRGIGSILKCGVWVMVVLRNAIIHLSRST